MMTQELKNGAGAEFANSISSAACWRKFAGFTLKPRRNFAAGARNQLRILPSLSGNFGDLTAGLLAKSLGLPVNNNNQHRFIAATNVNDNCAAFSPRRCRKRRMTLSNAMDVSQPQLAARGGGCFGPP
ncbi:hypothetical protein KCP71_01880 [Salmonella enterica subsp. enterica]|nr:hypothetical protein KCP71_01880 [Salmonella enterica subsp. enterica]